MSGLKDEMKRERKEIQKYEKVKLLTIIYSVQTVEGGGSSVCDIWSCLPLKSL